MDSIVLIRRYLMDPAHELIGKYRTALNRSRLAYATVILWSHPDTPEVFEKIHAALDERLRVFPDVGQLLHDWNTMKIACDDLYMSTYRSALTDLFELTKVYCEETGQMEKLKEQTWFELWRILRNCFSHDNVFKFNKYEISKLPITWSGVTLDESMNGKPLTHGRMPYAKMHQLIAAAQTFLLSDVA